MSYDDRYSVLHLNLGHRVRVTIEGKRRLGTLGRVGSLKLTGQEGPAHGSRYTLDGKPLGPVSAITAIERRHVFGHSDVKYLHVWPHTSNSA